MQRVRHHPGNPDHPDRRFRQRDRALHVSDSGTPSRDGNRGFPRRNRGSLGILVLAWCLLFPPGLASGAPAALNPEEPPYDPEKGFEARADTSDVQRLVSDTLMVMRFSGDTLVVPYFANLRVDEPHPGITRAVVVIHGTLRNARDYYRSVRDGFAGRARGGLHLPHCGAAVPHRGGCRGGHALGPAISSGPTWAGAKETFHRSPRPIRGRLASVPSLWSIPCSCELAALNPDLEDIVVAGHSAGGQFVNRYAAGNPVHEPLFADYGITLHYVVSNPSSYLYFDAKRWVPATESEFAVPYDELASCPNYDKYKYGLVAPNEYMNSGPSHASSQLLRRGRSPTSWVGTTSIRTAATSRRTARRCSRGNSACSAASSIARTWWTPSDRASCNRTSSPSFPGSPTTSAGSSPPPAVCTHSSASDPVSRTSPIRRGGT